MSIDKQNVEPTSDSGNSTKPVLDAANETLFWGLFDSGLKSHDRMVLFKSRKGLQDFYNWLQEKRKEIETSEGRPVLIRDMKYIIGGG